MSQLVTFIPKTMQECRELLEKLSAHREGMTVTDRLGYTTELTSDDVARLIALIEGQIGEKAPMAAPSEVSAEAVEENPIEEEPIKRTSKKTRKNED